MTATSFFLLFSFFCGFLLDYPWVFLPFFHLSTIFLISYHGSLYHPESVKLLHLVFLGIVIDVLSGRPMGVTSLSLCAVGWVTFSYRVTILNGGFGILWMGSFLACLLGNFFFSVVDFFLTERFPPLLPSLLSVICSGLLYPYLASVYRSLEQRVGR